jgi:hypothetical protein
MAGYLFTAEGFDSYLHKNGPSAHGRGGQRFHAGIIIRVKNESIVDLHVYFGDGTEATRQSVQLLPENVLVDGVHRRNAGWRWPPVVR